MRIDSRPGQGSVVLTEEECRQRLCSATAGFLAITARALPFVLPVALVLIGDDLLLDPLLGGQAVLAVDTIVALAVGSLDGETPWSVTAQGVLVAPRTPPGVPADPDRPRGRYLFQTELLTGWQRGPL